MADFSNWQRQHGFGAVLMMIRNIWIMIKSIWPVAIALWTTGESAWQYALIGGASILFLIGVYSVVEFFRFKFRVVGEALFVEKGVLDRKKITISLDRIQAVQLTQSPVQRILGLTGLSIDTAGSSGSELSLVAMKTTWAIALKMRLSKETLPDPEGELNSPKEKKEQLIRLGWRQLIRIGLGQNHLRNGFILLAAPLSVIEQIDGALIEGFFEQIPMWVTLLFYFFSFLLWLPALVVVLAVGVVASIALVLLKYHDLRLETAESEQLSLHAGLIKRFGFTMQRPKVQTAQWVSTPLMRSLNFERLQLSQARAGNSDAAQGGELRIPGVEPQERTALERFLFPTLNLVKERSLEPVAFFRWLVFIRWFILGLLSWWITGWVALAISFVWAGWFVSERSAKGRFVRHNKDDISVQQGWWKKTCTMTRIHQIQSVSIRQSFWHAYRGIAHLTLHTAAGHLKVGFVNASEARAFADFVLQQAEMSDKPWM